MAFQTNSRTKRWGLKKPRSNQERRFTILMVYSHGKTRTLSCGINTVVALGAAVCVAIATFGYFINSYNCAKTENIKLNYLNQVAEDQEQTIKDMQDYLSDLSDRLKQAELEQSETRSMLEQEGLIEQALDDQAIVASRRTDMLMTSRSGVDRNRTIPLEAVRPVLDSLEEYASSLNASLTDLEDNLKTLKDDAVSAVDRARAQPNIWPVNGSITSYYGWRKHPITRRDQFHDGLDIGGSYGASIKAAADGTVTFAGYKSGYGWTIEISHGYGLKTAYCHCSSLKASSGQKVRRGDIVAAVGISGVATGPHLHYEVYKDGKRQNPLDYLPK